MRIDFGSRASGRTSRMVDEVWLEVLKGKNCVVFAANEREANRIFLLFEAKKALGLLVTGSVLSIGAQNTIRLEGMPGSVKVESVKASSVDAKTGLSRYDMFTSLYMDHYAAEQSILDCLPTWAMSQLDHWNGEDNEDSKSVLPTGQDRGKHLHRW